MISDVKFSRNGVDDSNAGVDLLNYIKSNLEFQIPLLLQSHDALNALALS